MLAGAASASSQQVATPAPKVIAHLPQTAAGGHLILSPDGKVVLMSVGKGLYHIDRATGAFTKVADGEFSDATWSRNNRLVFDRADENNDDYIWSAPIDPATGKLTAAPRRVSLGAGDTPIASPDGKSIAFAKDDDPVQVVAVMPANGGPERVLARGTGGINPFAWSADGQWIYYDAAKPGGSGFSISRVSTSGKNEVLVEKSDGMPSLSPDGKYIVFNLSRDTATFATADGRLIGSVRIADAASGLLAHTPHWLPGSEAVLFTTTRRGTAVTAVSLGDGRSRVLGDSSTRSAFPAVSPDGKSVAALSAVGGRLQVTIRPLAGGAARAIRTIDVPFEYPLTWSPDGRSIAVHTGRMEHAARPAALGLEVVDVAGGKSQRVATAPDVRRVHWSTDGRAIRYVHQVTESNGTPTQMEVRETGVGGGDKLVRAIDASGGMVFAGYDQVYLIAKGQIVDLASGSNKQLVPPAAVPEPVARNGPRPVPVVSPDLQWVAWPAATSGTRPLNAITLVSTKTGERRTIQLSFSAANPEAGLLWHPDGKHLIVTSTPSGGSAHAYLVPLSGTPARVVANVDFSSEGLAVSISPDGGTLVVSREGVPSVDLVELSVAPLLSTAARR
jgi:Tol biopolymer transport system component